MQRAEQSGQDAGHQNAFGPQSADVSATKWAGMVLYGVIFEAVG